MRHLFLVNPHAGRRDCTDEITASAKELGEPFTIRVSAAAGDLARFAREAGETGEETRLYACGGDGTLHEVVSACADYDNLSVTSIPFGSGNDFIKQFAHPEAFSDIAGFRDVRTVKIDLIDAGGIYTVNICSVGFDARIGTAIDAYRRLPLLSGPRAYHASVVVNLIKGVAKPCRVEFCEGAAVNGELSLVCVCNGSWYGGSYHPVPEASIRDGILDVLVVKKVSRLTVARVIAAYQKGRYMDYPEIISHYRTSALRIVTPKDEPVNLDGELVHSRDIRISLLPQKLRFFAPNRAWGEM